MRAYQIYIFLMVLTVALLLSNATLQAQRPSLPTPPSGVWIGDSLFIDESEIANVHWQEYLHYIERDSSAAYYRSQIPDTSIVITYEEPQTGEMFRISYYRYEGYRFYPLLGVSYEQAQAYCRWRSEVVSASLNKNKKSIYDGYEIRVTYRLPTEDEWERAALCAQIDIKAYPYGKKEVWEKPQNVASVKDLHRRWAGRYSKKEIKKARKKYLKEVKVPVFNTSHSKPVPKILRKAEDRFTKSVYEGTPHACDKPIFNLIGNAAEMVAEKGIAKGGSWIHDIEESRIKDRQLYRSPTPWLGFRCIAEVQLLKQ
ncbi:MAG: SUMF1/EgtB/PvdO family nonheme iron enzyme [Bernardetiaceae bacterium]|nr:SUMF1/EgtB/PvdO family nonheme iron enzyme [Bernardetiaceae bacterium]